MRGKRHPRSHDVSRIQEHRAWRGENSFGRPFSELSALDQAKLLVDIFGRRHENPARTTMTTTKQERARLLRHFVEVLHEQGFRIGSLTNLGDKHISVAVKAWQAQGIGASTLRPRLSILRWATKLLGKPGLVKPPEFYGIAVDRGPRDKRAAANALWSAQGTEPTAKIQEIRVADPWVAAQLSLMRAFGLTVMEAILLNPATSDRDGTLHIIKGVKAGRSRKVAIESPEQREALTVAQALASGSERGSMVPPGKTPQQAQRRLYYICERAGVTRAQLHVTPRGLRLEHLLDAASASTP